MLLAHVINMELTYLSAGNNPQGHQRIACLDTPAKAVCIGSLPKRDQDTMIAKWLGNFAIASFLLSIFLALWRSERMQNMLEEGLPSH